MKVQCDVCAAEAASVFCCADEAALCDGCDQRVHLANKLASKHRRLSLLHPSPSSSSASSAQKPPLCDICQEKRGFLFCKEDRAILCRDCDVQVHTASELTRRHGRFLLTGVRVSSAPADSPASSKEETEEENSSSPCNADSCSGDGAASATASASDSSSISEYLTKTLPGWHVEDFLLDDAAASAAVAVSLDEPYQEGYPAWRGGGSCLMTSFYARVSGPAGSCGCRRCTRSGPAATASHPGRRLPAPTGEKRAVFSTICTSSTIR